VVESFAPDRILEAVAAVPWKKYGEERDQVVNAFRRLTRVQSERDARTAYDVMLDTIAHNHSGWLYDSAGPAAPILAAIARHGTGWIRYAALEILIEVASWARPDQRFVDPAGVAQPMPAAVRAAVEGLRAELEILSVDEHDEVPHANSARELLEFLASPGWSAG